jgi:hypothetical protein
MTVQVMRFLLAFDTYKFDSESELCQWPQWPGYLLTYQVAFIAFPGETRGVKQKSYRDFNKYLLTIIFPR